MTFAQTHEKRLNGAFAAPIRISEKKNGAAERTRTSDPRITNALLYQLSYSGTPGALLAPHCVTEKCYFTYPGGTFGASSDVSSTVSETTSSPTTLDSVSASSVSTISASIGASSL